MFAPMLPAGRGGQLEGAARLEQPFGITSLPIVLLFLRLCYHSEEASYLRECLDFMPGKP